MLEGIFKSGFEYYTRIDGKFNKATFKWTLFEQDSEGEYTFIDFKTKLKKRTFPTKKAMEDYYNTYKDMKTIIKLPQDIIYAHQFWQSEYKKPRILYLDIETIDLKNREFPKPHLAKAPITHIQMKDSETGQVIILYTKEPSLELKKKWNKVKFIKCKDDKDILERYATIIKKLNPTIITAYNGHLFDYPYIFFKAIQVGLDPKIFSPLSDYSIKIDFKLKDGSYKKYYSLDKILDFIRNTDEKLYKVDTCKIKMAGHYLLDYYEVYRKFTYGDLPSYTLEYITKIHLKQGEGKVSYKHFSSIYEFYEKDYDGFFEYSIMDVETLNNLENNLKFFDIVGVMSWEMGANMDDVLATVKPWAVFLTHLGLKRKLIMPEDSMNGKLDKSIVGGFVKNPIKGKHEWLFSYDYNSLFPSIINTCNICATTYIQYNELPEEAKKIVDYLKDEDESKLLKNEKMMRYIKMVTHKYNLSFAGCAFYRKDIKGIVPEIVKSIYYDRKKEKNRMLLANAIISNEKGTTLISVNEIIEKIDNDEITWENVYDIKIKDIENLSVLETYANVKDAIQMAKKIQINSLYGAISNAAFILFNRDNAASITFMSRLLNRLTGQNIDKYLSDIEKSEVSKIIYQDTDSVLGNTEIYLKSA